MTDARHITIAVVLMLMVAFAVFCVYRYGYNIGASSVKPLPADTVVIHHTDTFWVKLPPDTITQVYYKTVRVPQDAVEADAVVDSFSVTLPFERHFAQLGDAADVWYSGYEARIDSARIYQRHTTEIVNHYTTEIRQQSNMVMATAGAMDVSVGYLHRFGTVWVGAYAGYTYAGKPTVRGSVGFQF